VAEKNPKKRDDGRAPGRSNTERLYELANRGLVELGMTREELHRKLGLPPPPAPRRPQR
jgi:hypothetical protein